MYLAKITKTGKRILSEIYGIFPLFYCVAFHVCFWLSNKTELPIFIYVVGSIISLVFLFGAAFLTTGCITMRNNELCINEDNKVFQLMKRIPVNFEGESICKISLVAVICLILLPVFYIMLVGFSLVVSSVICAVTWQNPIAYFREIIKLEGWPSTKIMVTKNNWPKNPLLYLTPVAALGYVVNFAATHSTPFFKVLGAMCGIAIAIVMCSKLLVFTGNKLVTRYEGTKVDYDLFYVLNKFKEKNPAVRPLYTWVVLWQAFRQKFCPKIKYCSKSNMPNEIDDEPYESRKILRM